MKSIVLDLPFAPSLPWFYLYLSNTEVWIEQQESFVKSSYRNRCDIASPSGRLSLSIPIEGGKDHHRLYREARMAQDFRWRKIHFQSLASAYRRTPFFEYYEDSIRSLYENPEQYLFSWNQLWLDWILKVMKLQPRHQFTSSWNAIYSDKTDARQAISPGKQSADLLLHYSSPKYIQAFETRTGFIPDLSILDFLFQEGPHIQTLTDFWGLPLSVG